MEIWKELGFSYFEIQMFCEIFLYHIEATIKLYSDRMTMYTAE